MKIDTEHGYIDVSNDVFRMISGHAATNCLFVKGMGMRSVADGLVRILKREAMGRGVRVSFDDTGAVLIDLHIVVEFGANLTALCRSVMGEVTYNVSRLTGVRVGKVNVFVDSILVTSRR